MVNLIRTLHGHPDIFGLLFSQGGQFDSQAVQVQPGHHLI